ncbi:nucleoside phosphorylase domain-containing protein [Ilyonectria destructans]|nr:nucleoside phosphorylase domain-containing protein [Ilyonectria destructans]
MPESLSSAELYTVGWIAALYIERAAATILLDHRHDAPQGFEQHPSDTNSYSWGRMGKHNIVIASLAAGQYGTVSAATTASNLAASLPHLRFGLLVGIGGGIPRRLDIRLGDVVVSHPEGTSGGVVQYDLGKAAVGEVWERKGSLNAPPTVLLSALANLRGEHEISGTRIPEFLQSLQKKNPPKLESWIYQGAEHDRLFMPAYTHTSSNTCESCDEAFEITRSRRSSQDPEIHYGIIASGNVLVKDAATRDGVAEIAGEQCLCVEMEAAGLMQTFPCLVIRGICDYADSHKNDRWQRYASATAAAYAKELLDYIPIRQLNATPELAQVLGSINENLERIEVTAATTKEEIGNLG